MLHQLLRPAAANRRLPRPSTPRKSPNLGVPRGTRYVVVVRYVPGLGSDDPSYVVRCVFGSGSVVSCVVKLNSQRARRVKNLRPETHANLGLGPGPGPGPTPLRGGGADALVAS